MGRPPLPIGTWGDVAVSGPKGGPCVAVAYFRDYDGVTRRVTRKGKSSAAARTALLTYLTERTMPSGDDLTAETRLSAVAEIYLDEGKWAINTARRYREVWLLHLAPAVGNLRVREATVTRLDRTVKAIQGSVGAGTAKHARVVLSGIMTLAVRHGASSTNPVANIAPVVVATKEVRPLTLDEVARVRAAAHDAVHPPEGTKRRGRLPSPDLIDIIEVMLGTGARIGEVLALRWEDVDLDPDQPRLSITGTIVWEDGVEGGPRHLFRQPHPKTKKSERDLLLPRFVADVLMRRRVASTSTSGMVFTSHAGTLRDPASVRVSWNRIRTKAGLGWVTPHTFRKTVATLIYAERDTRAAADQLGNSEGVTRKHYLPTVKAGPDARDILAALAPADYRQ